MNAVRATMAVLGVVLLAGMVSEHGLESWATAGTAALALGAIGLLVVSTVLALRMITIAEWIMRLGEGDLEYRVRLSGKDELALMCLALEKVRDRTVRVVRLPLVERLAEELETSNAELREIVESLTRAQDQIVARQKAAELGELTAGVAHEIRNPLNFIRNFTESTRDLVQDMAGAVRARRDAIGAPEMEAIETVEGEIGESLERVVAHTGRADVIVKRMLMLGTPPGAVEYVKLNALVGEHARLACRSAEGVSEGLEVGLEETYDEAVGAVPVVAQGIARVVLNLVGNACYAVNERRAGEAQGYEPAVRVTTRKGGEWIEVEVRDNGPGIDEAILDRVMTPFFTTKPPNVGAGLGLSQCADTVRQHRGTIKVESRAGAGTTVRIGLPAGGGEQETDKPPRSGRTREPPTLAA